MDKIKLIYVSNVFGRSKKTVQQTLSFFITIENAGYDKAVEVIWAGEDGVWQTLPVLFHSAAGENQEFWYVQTHFKRTLKRPLPGNIEFAVRYRVAGQEFWDNNHGLNYSSQADSGVQLLTDASVLNIEFPGGFQDGQKFIPVTVAVRQSLGQGQVYIHWSTDRWKHSQKTACHFKSMFWDKTTQSNARNPNQYGIAIWKGWIRAGQCFRLEYAVSFETDHQIIWDNNHGRNYVLSHDPLKILILNLHCYQEDNQDYKLSQIAKAIDDMKADIVCLQEVAEPWNDGMGDWENNSAKIINERLPEPFHIYTDWSHLGFDKYREGVAILSRYPFIKQDARYVSDSHDAYSIHSRKVVMGQFNVPLIGLVNVYSAHLSWLEDGFEAQFNRLNDWAQHNHNARIKATLLCGDFNIVAGSSGYDLVVNSNAYEDQYLEATAHGVFEKVFRVNDPYWHDYMADDYRIDYIFMNKASELKVTSGRTVFTDKDYGFVSDHCGYYMTFEPK
ncbi:MAG: endonuclease/exonuclease/phosphatase family protein [Methylicorpusculum sp.]|nr:endonuclease/exonuclease/phosphatase family protein [Methylicorpusculum sp.]